MNTLFILLLFLLPACYDPELKDDCSGQNCLVISEDFDPPLADFEKLRFENSYECRCECGIDVDGNGNLEAGEVQITHELQVCMLPEHNPNLGGDDSPSNLTADCRERVRPNLQRISRECVAGDGANDYLCRNCEALAVRAPVAACNRDVDPDTAGLQPCRATPLETDPDTLQCTNFDPQAEDFFKNATHHPDLANLGPVCLADRSDPPLPTASPLAAGIFGHVAKCDVGGIAMLEGGEHEAGGTVYFTGTPCPGGSCEVGMFFGLRVQDFERTGDFIPLVDFGKAQFREMRGWGSSTPGGAVLSDFAGHFDEGEVLSTGRGVTETFVCIPGTDSCTSRDTFSDAILARNEHPLSVTFDSAGSTPTCSLTGQLSTLGDGFAVDLVGSIVNQPPQANAGADHTEECTSSAGAAVTLDGSLSSDPDTDDPAKIKLFSWRRGGRAGEQVALESMADVALALGETQTYVLTVVDGFGQASHDSVVVGVADTTAPSIACNLPDPATITPEDGLDEDDPNKPPISFTATATDACDPTASASIISFDCYAFARGGKRIDKKRSCAVAIDGATITILNAGGVDTRIQWVVRGADDSGNAEHKACEVLVVKP